MRTKELFSGLVLLIGVCSIAVCGISIDSQLKIVKSDCYERLAIGQRIHKKDVYRKPNARTFTECQMECTTDGEKCRSFSYGVGVKGNTTCELTSNMINQTIDQKPLGTTDDTDYDLYIKKMDCDLGLDIHPSLEGLPAEAPITGSYLPEENPGDVHGYTSSSNIPLPFNTDYVKTSKRRPEQYKKQKDYPVLEHRQDTNQKDQSQASYGDDQSTFDHDYLGAVSYNRYPDKLDDGENKYDTDSNRYGSGSKGYDSGSKGYDSGSKGYDSVPKGYNSGPKGYNSGPKGYESGSNGYDSDSNGYDSDPKGYDSANNPNIGYKKKVPYDYIGSNGPPRGYGYSNRPVKKPKPIPLEDNYDYTPQKPAGNGYEYQKPPFRPVHLNNPYNDQEQRPGRPDRPGRPGNFDDEPDNTYGRPESTYGGADNTYRRPGNTYGETNQEDRPNYHENHKPTRPNHDHYGPNAYSDPDDPNYRPITNQNSLRPLYQYNHHQEAVSSLNYGSGLGIYGKPAQFSGFKPVTEHSNDYGSDEYPKRPNFGFLGGVYQFVDGEYRPYGSGGNFLSGVYGPKYPHRKPMLEDGFGGYGDLVTSSLTRDKDVCFRRALAGKRISRAFVRKAISCERVEDCQQECSDEKRFVCEGFNYRLDPSGRGRGDCELLDIPFDLLDVHRDVIPNPNFDYYEKDRNSFRRCKDNGLGPVRPQVPSRPNRPYHNSDRDNLPPPSHHGVDYFSHYGNEDRYRDTHRYDSDGYPDSPGYSDSPGYPDSSSYPDRPPYRYGHRIPHDGPDYRPFNRRSDIPGHFHAQDKPHPPNFDTQGYQYLPPPGIDHRPPSIEHRPPPIDHRPPTIDHKPPGTYLPPSNGLDFDSPKKHSTSGYGLVVKVPSYHDNEVPLPIDGHGIYGGTYGSGGYHKPDQDYWGLNVGGYNGPSVIKPVVTSHYLPPKAVPGDDGGYNYGRNRGPLEECSLRTATGYRLYRKIVKKIISVPTIIDCESACFRETEFRCTSYAFRYIIGSDIPPNNCYLSDRNYKELDYYTDLEQDRNFDIYTMNNKERCGGLIPHQRDTSECFLHVRSGQRLDDSCSRQSFFAKSFVDCELECLRANRFTCRTFTYRYGSAIIGGIAENCQLSDVPFKELDPHKDLIPDPGFVLYERASYGYGCELDHGGKGYVPKDSMTAEADKVCYVGYGWPARLLPQAIRKVLSLRTEEECKAECTRLRMETPFCCMSFSYSSTNSGPNCFLSDVFQRDLLETVDYVRDPDYWLFSWDNTNPECRFPDYYEQRVPFENRNAVAPGFAIWRVYSVGGWPCKRGTLCRQSEVGFWFCELEGGSPSSWDYCCRPGHQCGYSEGFPYQWCYVGHSSTQWRKCNDKYYPYLPQIPIYTPPSTKPSTTYPPYVPASTPNSHTRPPSPNQHTITPTTSTTYIPTPNIFIEQPKRTYLPPVSHREPRPWQTSSNHAFRPSEQLIRPSGFRPDRPKAPPGEPQPTPSLNEYEEQFDNLFLDPPRPGGFGQPRHWPISYLHKETPPNASAPIENVKFEQMKQGKESRVEPKYEAIESLIKIIKSNDLNNIKYQITNESNKEDDILHVQIPLPTNLTAKFEKKPEKIDDGIVVQGNKSSTITAKEGKLANRSLPVYRRSYIEKTNITDEIKKNSDRKFSV